ncbi:MAG: hypothetical protein LBK00_05240 [Treponema sp.]|nr:hypothetical protein [Treponema sp.]
MSTTLFYGAILLISGHRPHPQRFFMGLNRSAFIDSIKIKGSGVALPLLING